LREKWRDLRLTGGWGGPNTNEFFYYFYNLFYVSWKRFALAVLLRRPPVKIDFHWRFYYVDRQLKSIFTGVFITSTASENRFSLAVFSYPPVKMMIFTHP
jgi:hypothetical protein